MRVERLAAIVWATMSLACTSGGGTGEKPPAPEDDAAGTATEPTASGVATPSFSRCLAPPAFLHPIVVAPPGRFAAGIDDAWLASVDDDRTLVLAAGPPDGAGDSDVEWTIVDRRRGSVAPWKPYGAGPLRVTHVVPLSGGAVGVTSFRSDTFAFQADARVFLGDDWSPPLSATRAVSSPISSISPLGDQGVLAVWSGGASTLRQGFWSPPITFDAIGLPFVEMLSDGGALLVEQRAVDVGSVYTPLAVDARGGWSTSGASPIVASSVLFLRDGTTMAALLRPRGDGVSQVWVSAARPPQPWSAPAPILGADGAPVLVDDDARFDRMLFPLGDHDAELVAWTTPCAADECERAPTSIRWVDGAWQSPIDLTWGPGTRFERRHVFAVDDRTPLIAREGAFRVRLDDRWSDVAGISDETIDAWSLLAATDHGIWMRTGDPKTSHAQAIFIDVVRHTSRRTDIPWVDGIRALGTDLPVFVDASGAFVLAPNTSFPADVLRWSTPDAEPETLPLTLEGESGTQLLDVPLASDARPASEIYAVRATLASGARLRVMAWNEAGSATATIDGGRPFPFRAEWRGCGGALLYGYADASLPHRASTMLLLPIR